MSRTFELTAEILMPVLTRFFGAEPASITDFEMIALKPGAGNPTSLGVYRARGYAIVAGEAKPFSLVVKHLANGAPIMDASSETNWNYWLREIKFFGSALADRIPKSIGYPKYFGESPLSDGTALFWNEDLGDIEKSKWTWDDCINAVHLLVEINSIDSSDLDKYKWLNRNEVDGWRELGELWNAFVPTETRLRALAAQKKETADALAVYGRYMNRYDLLGELLLGGRQAFGHGDFNLHNLVPMRSGDVSLIALDWQLTGVFRIGSEVCAIFNTAVEDGVIGLDAAKFEELCAIYTARFNELNPSNPISLNEVRLAAAAKGLFIIQGMGYFFSNAAEGDTEEQIQAKVQGLLNDLTNGVNMVYARVLQELT